MAPRHRRPVGSRESLGLCVWKGVPSRAVQAQSPEIKGGGVNVGVATHELCDTLIHTAGTGRGSPGLE